MYLYEVVLGEVRHTLLGDHDIRLECYYMGTNGLDVFLFLPEQGVEVLLVHDLHIGLALPLLVLQRTVQQQDAGVLNPKDNQKCFIKLR